MKKNMKIEINKDQPIDEVVATLESKGYKSNGDYESDDKAIIVINGVFFGWGHTDNWSIPLTTLADLKEMK